MASNKKVVGNFKNLRDLIEDKAPTHEQNAEAFFRGVKQKVGNERLTLKQSKEDGRTDSQA